MSILILLKDKYIYTDIYTYLGLYENVKVTLIRQLALVILIRSSRPPIRCPRMPTRCPRMPSRWVRQSHDVSNSTHDWNRSTRQSFTVKLCRTGFPITADRFPTEQTSKMSVRCCYNFMSPPCHFLRFFRSLRSEPPDQHSVTWALLGHHAYIQ